MTTLPFDVGIQLGGGQSQGTGLLGFLGSPQASALAQGLLAASQPSMRGPQTLGGGFAQGLGLARDEAERQRRAQMDERRFNLEEMRQNLEVQKLGQSMADAQRKQQAEEIRRARIENMLGMMGSGGLLAQQAPTGIQGAVGPGLLNGAQVPIDTGMAQEAPQRVIPEIGAAQAQQPLGLGFSQEQLKNARLAYALGDERAAIMALTTPDKVSEATTQFRTSNQRAVQAIDNVLPEIDKMIGKEYPVQVPGVTHIVSPGRQADYRADTAQVVESLLSAFQLPQTDASVKKIAAMVEKQPFESDANYDKRLRRLQGDLKRRREAALKVTGGRYRGAEEQGVAETTSDDPLGLF